MLKAHGPLKAKEIATKRIDGGYAFDGPISQLQNRLYNALERDKSRFRKIDLGTWEGI